MGFPCTITFYDASDQPALPDSDNSPIAIGGDVTPADQVDGEADYAVEVAPVVEVGTDFTARLEARGRDQGVFQISRVQDIGPLRRVFLVARE